MSCGSTETGLRHSPPPHQSRIRDRPVALNALPTFAQHLITAARDHDTMVWMMLFFGAMMVVAAYLVEQEAE